MIIDKTLTYIPTPQELRYHKGVVVGLHISYNVEYDGVTFSSETEWSIPEERQCYAEEFTPERHAKETEYCYLETGLQTQTFEKIFLYKQQKASQ